MGTNRQHLWAAHQADIVQEPSQHFATPPPLTFCSFSLTLLLVHPYYLVQLPFPRLQVTSSGFNKS